MKRLSKLSPESVSYLVNNDTYTHSYLLCGLVVHSPSLESIHHQFTPSPPHPCRDDKEDLTEVFDFIQKCDFEIPDRFLGSEFEDDESDEESSEDDYDTNNDEYDSFSQAKICEYPQQF